MRTAKPLLTALAALATSLAFATITIRSNVKDGQVVAGEFTFRITVESDSLVRSVEFYVGDDLRGTDESTPYEFTVDTLQEKDGEFKVTFAAFNQDGKQARQTLSLKVENGLGKGVDFHLERGQDFLANSAWADAIQAGRVALKIAPTDNRARLLMARANLGLRVFDLAQKFAEDAAEAAPKDRAPLDLLSAIHLRRGFSTFAGGVDDRKETLVTLKAAFKAASEARVKSLDLAVEALGEPTPANRIALADTLLAAGRYSRVISILAPVFRETPKDNAVAARLLYAQIRAGRIKDAAQTMKDVDRFGEPDGYVYALKSILYVFAGDTRQALEMEKEAILSDPTGVGVKTAQAYLALRRNDTKTMGNLANELQGLAGQSPVVQYNLSALYFLDGQYDQAESRFQEALLAEPASYDTYIERANQSLFFAVQSSTAPEDAQYQRDLAAALFEAALVARPESFEAHTGLAAVRLLDGKAADAVTSANAAVKAGAEYAPAHYVRAAALFATRQSEEARVAIRQAEALDPRGLGGRPIPTPTAAWRYFSINGRVPYIAPPGN